jgi:carbon storage regulator
MLILTRKENQKIRIGNNIVLNIISISDNNVKIGIEAEKDVTIFREEIYQQIIENNKKSTINKPEILPENLKSLKINKILKDDEKK